MLFFLISIFYVLSCDAVGNIGEVRKIGRGWSFIFSLLLTPILGYAITSLSKELEEDDIDSEIVYKEIYRNKHGNVFAMSFARVIAIIISINSIMFCFEVLLNLKGVMSIIDPITLYMGGSKFHVYQFITHQFVHSGVGHLYGNMLVLLAVGPSVERRYGSKKTIFGYLIFGIVGGLVQMMMMNLNDNMAGASGAVYGMITVFAFSDSSHYLRFKWFKVRYLAMFLIALELYNLNVAGDGIGHWAHFGGMLAGFVFYLTQRKDGKET